MRFKSLVVGQQVELRGRLVTVKAIKDWADGSRTVGFEPLGIFTRKANVLVSSI